MQGVGFRPFVYGLAKEFSLCGTVANTLEGVHIYVNADSDKMTNFISRIKEKAPRQSLITSIEYEEAAAREFDKFSIVESESGGVTDLLITPDFAICEKCKEELLDRENRRFHYSYITCTECGPRFSIETSLPYDRDRTSMEPFKMCDHCEKEYQDPLDRRFYSQTNSCAGCKVTQWIIDPNGDRLELTQEEVVDFICEKIAGGSVVAVKGIGGFLLMCDAQNEKRIRELRKQKDRPAKPFALMYPNVERVLESFEISDEELSALKSAAAPIVLLRLKSGAREKEMTSYIAPGLDRLGVMLPYAPLLVLIMEKVAKPLLATSGNLRGSPITYKNDETVQSLHDFADYFLMNDRNIQIPQDDSVIKFSRKYRQKIVIRRSRGYAPGFLQEGQDAHVGQKVLAMGALLKSAFTIWQNGRCHISQFLGDTRELEAQVSYEQTLSHFIKVLRFEPEVILVDKHPAYFSTHLGKEMARDFEIKIKTIQHHEAHFWAVLGENGLVDSDGKILGVVLDGTGMGNDGAIWGGEFFMYDNGHIERSHHLKYYPHILGDKMSKEPRLSALAVLHAADCGHHLNAGLFSEQELDFYHKVLDGSSLKTSSMGRVFDAISSILGLCHINSYEGEAAMYLEQGAEEYCVRTNAFPDGYGFEIDAEGAINLCPMIKSIIKDLDRGEEISMIAARFHSTVVRVIDEVARSNEASQIAFSGGVMQNGLLVDMFIQLLGGKYKLHFHHQLSPNDECISYGQLTGYRTSARKAEKKFVNSKSVT